MKIRNKILLILLAALLLIGGVIALIWYRASSELTNTYLEDVSESSMRDACNAFGYLLTDTSYMATLVATNQKNIIDPVSTLNKEVLMDDGQWNQTYLDNRRVILDYITALNGYKYYIAGIAVIANRDCIFDNSHVVQFKGNIYDQIQQLEPDRLKYSMTMLEPLHLEDTKSTVSSDYVLPGVRGIADRSGNIIGYVVIYFDYGVIDQMFSDYLPAGSYFQVSNDSGSLIFSNSDGWTDIESLEGNYAKNSFREPNVGWTFSMAIPSEFYVSEIRRTALLTGILMAVIVSAAWLLSMVLISRVVAEITVLRERMKTVSSGDLTVRYQVRSKDEIGQIGQTFNRMVERIDELMHRVAQEEQAKRRNEIAFLQAQINPHFVSNVLNNVAWMAKIQHADNIVPLVNSLNALLRNVVHQEQAFIPLAKELDYVENYLTIMSYSGSYDFQVEREFDESAAALWVPRFILQPVVENAIVHGLPEDLSRQGCIRMTTLRSQEELQIVVEDNGRGMTSEEMQALMRGEGKRNHNFSGIGVLNVNERIRLYCGETYGLSYESVQGEYTRCIIRLPVIEEERDE